ncbi:hypothetical protein [Ensifer sp. ENS02]|uniref:hypothetical protein n=1 Tax=Ensifer sp. ENS02 TaxID=2769290 RepID=UPI001FED9AF0|nr:hypothetical protein [Ensifer sp. ENS02]
MIAARSARLLMKESPVEEIEGARNVDAWISALSKVPLRLIGEEELPLSDAYVQVLTEAIVAMNSGEPTVLMTWPARDICLSAVASLLALADVAVAPGMTVEKYGGRHPSFERPSGFKALIYPYARTTHELARDVQVDRSYLAETHRAHFMRCAASENEPAALKDYHQILSRVKTLDGRARDGRLYPEFEHPTLDEILPHGTCDGSAHSNGTLLWRTSSRTDLKEHNTVRRHADNGNEASYFLYGLKKGDEVSMRKIRGRLDVIIFDLTRTGRGRLGDEWVERVTRIYKAMRKAFPTSGVVALTEDPWTFDKARFEIFNHPPDLMSRKPRQARSKTITAISSSILKAGGETFSWSGCDKVEAKGFNGPGTKVAEELRSAARKMVRANDGVGASAVDDIIFKLRRNASLPSSLASLSNYSVAKQGNAAAADLMSSYRITEALQYLRDPANAAYQLGGAELAAALGEAEEASRLLVRETPMANLLQAIVTSILNSSSKALFMFRTQPLAEFAIVDLARKIPDLQGRLDNEMIVFSGPGGLTDIAALPPADRNKFKRIYVVAPPRDGVLTFFARQWLPSQIFVLADGDTLQFSSRDAFRLADQVEEQEIASRLRKYGTVAADELGGLGTFQIRITETPPPPTELQFPSESVIDLAGAAGTKGVELLEFTMESGQRMIARPGTDLVRLDRSRSLETFKHVEAKDVRDRDELCVISSGFIDRARLLLSIPANAAEAIREYHEDVLTRFRKLPGLSDAEKLRALIERIGDPEVDAQRVRYWVHVDKQLQAQLHEVVPHAPRDRDMFLKLTAALGIGQSLANRFWYLGVKAQRNSRMRAGMAFHEAYRGVLTDPHAAAAFAGDAKRASEIKRLQRLAEEHVSAVRSIRRFKS